MGAPDRRRRDRRGRLLLWVLVGVTLSVAIGVGREVIQNLGDAENSIGDAVADVVAWTLGAIIAGGVALGVRWRLKL
jgi:hypothetical protein